MALTLVDMVGFEYSNVFKDLEGKGSGSGVSIQSSPTPYPQEHESNVLRLLQNSSQSYWPANTFSSIGQGDVLSISFYYYPQRTGWPMTNDSPLFQLVNDTPSPHIILNMTANGSACDVQVKDAGGTVVGTISDGFPDPNLWYRVDMLVALQNKDVGAGGQLRLKIVKASNEAQTGTITISNEDFWASGNVGVYLQGETGTTPATAMTAYFGSFIMFSGASDPLDTSDYVGNYTITGALCSKSSKTPDCDENGNAGGDDLDVDAGSGGTQSTWDRAGDGASGVNQRACYTSSTAEYGAVKVSFPGSDDSIGLRAVRHGGSWIGLSSGGGRWAVGRSFIYGREDTSGSGYTVTKADTTIAVTKHRHIEADGGADMPALAYDGVVGWGNRGATLGSVTLNLEEAGHFEAFDYPVPGYKRVSLGKNYPARKRVVL